MLPDGLMMVFDSLKYMNPLIRTLQLGRMSCWSLLIETLVQFGRYVQSTRSLAGTFQQL